MPALFLYNVEIKECTWLHLMTIVLTEFYSIIHVFLYLYHPPPSTALGRYYSVGGIAGE